jgi:hypothetical protein
LRRRRWLQQKELLRHRPAFTVFYIGRIRKDSALFAVPAAQPATGRKRCYYGPQTLI